MVRHKLLILRRSIALLALLGCTTACGALGFLRSGNRHSSKDGDATTASDDDDLTSSGKKSGKSKPHGSSLDGSGTSRVRFKRQKLLENDLVKTLALPAEKLCVEPGGLSCVRAVHHLALGGVDPYEHSIFTGIAESVPSTPIALERIVLSACTQRAERDLAGEGVIFSGTRVDGNGRFTDTNALASNVTTLYRRGLARDPTATEITQLTDFYQEVVASADRTAARTWATLVCYSVLTSVEFVFY